MTRAWQPDRDRPAPSAWRAGDEDEFYAALSDLRARFERVERRAEAAEAAANELEQLRDAAMDERRAAEAKLAAYEEALRKIATGTVYRVEAGVHVPPPVQGFAERVLARAALASSEAPEVAE